MKNPVLFVVALGVATFGGCATLPGGGVAGGTAFAGSTAPAATRLTLLAVDRSKSTEKIRAQLLTTAFNIGTNFDRNRDGMRLFRFGNSIEEVYSQLPEDDDAFALILAQEVKASDPVPGTDYPRVLATLADAAANAPEAEIRIVIVGDGENDYRADAEFAKRYREAARHLSENSRLKWVRFWGVDTGTREEIRSVFKPLGRKLQILSLDQNPLTP